MFVLQHWIGGDGAGVCPWVELPQPKKERDEKERHQWNRAEARLQKAANHEPPPAAGQMMEHGHAETTERQTEPREIAEQVRDEELPSVQNCPDDAAH